MVFSSSDRDRTWRTGVKAILSLQIRYFKEIVSKNLETYFLDS